MGLDLDSVREQIFAIAKLQAAEPVGPVETLCYNCHEPIPEADYRITDDLGNSFDTFCWGDIRADMETDR